jgi:broad specificity phosphatase PhoE
MKLLRNISVISLLVIQYIFYSCSMKVDIYFVRHGETEANRAGILQGHCDYPLTEKGLRECEQVGTALKSVKWNKVFSSDLKRTLTTSDILLSKSETYDAKSNEGLSSCELLREMAFGVREMLPRATTIQEAIKIVALRENISIGDVVDTSETLQQLTERQVKFLSEILHPFFNTDNLSSSSVTNSGKSAISKNTIYTAEGERPRVLCVSHGGFIRKFLSSFCSSRLDSIGNCSISVVTVEWSSDSPLSYICTEGDECTNITDHYDI